MDKATNSGREPLEPQNSPVPDMGKKQDGQHNDHWVLSAEERSKGFIRPVRTTYKHLVCGRVTSMPQAIAETYARNPHFYGSTFCCSCKNYFPVGVNGEFIWDEGTNSKVGT